MGLVGGRVIGRAGPESHFFAVRSPSVFILVHIQAGVATGRFRFGHTGGSQPFQREKFPAGQALPGRAGVPRTERGRFAPACEGRRLEGVESTDRRPHPNRQRRFLRGATGPVHSPRFLHGFFRPQAGPARFGHHAPGLRRDRPAAGDGGFQRRIAREVVAFQDRHGTGDKDPPDAGLRPG